MKRLFLAMLALAAVLCLAACGGNGDETVDLGDAVIEPDGIDVIGCGYKVVYDITNSTAITVMTEMLNGINGTVGAKPASSHAGNPASEHELQFALKTGRAESEALYSETMRYASSARSVYVIRAVGNHFVVAASDNSALKAAAERLSGFAVADGFVIPADIDELVVFDTNSYLREGEVNRLDEKLIGGDVSLKSLTVGGTPIVGLSQDKTEYNVAANNPDSASVTAIPTEAGAEITVKTEGRTVTVSVTSVDRKVEKVYKVNLFQRTDSEVVNKNGANATVTYVIDDGDISTAKFIVDKMSPKYPSLTASFALITSKLATLDVVTGPDGSTEYAKDADGLYTYKKNESNWNYWQSVTENKNFELVSHSYSHQYWGENDGGGAFKFRTADGVEHTSNVFPKGSVSAEFAGSKQIIQDLDPSQRASVFVRTGLSHGGVMIDYSSTFWDPIDTSGEYIGARGTYTYPDKPVEMLNTFKNFADSPQRAKLNSYMVQHYNTSPSVKTTQAASGPAECLAAGIDYWTNYIDAAVTNNAWAAFCIHTIKPDTYDTRSGHYIYESQAEALFAYTDKLSEENKVWVAPLCEAMAYAIEWSSAWCESYVDGDKLVVSLEDEADGSDFNVALTVKVALPAGKTSASLNGKSLETVSENGKTYAYVDVVPHTTVLIDVK